MAITIKLPDKVKQILNTLENAGFEAYIVGGCVRDSILGRKPEDWDITTSAKPEQVKALFRRTVDTGIRHGTVTVMLGSEGFEVTTYRIDGKYEDGRHPKDVTFTASLEEDLKRRDFTINAMAYNPERGLVDLFGGMNDIERRLIRAVGDPVSRFTEDALRIMRAVRFSAQLDYTIEPSTLSAIAEMAPNLRKVSAERICTELTKLLISPHPGELMTMYQTGITAIILPEFDACMVTPSNNPHHIYSVGEHIIHSVEAVRADRVLRYTMLFHDFGKPRCHFTDENGIDHFPGHARVSAEIAVHVMKRLKFDNDTLNKVELLVANHDLRMDQTARSVRRGIARVGKDMFPLLMEVKVADGAAQAPYRLAEKKADVDRWMKLYREITARGDCIGLDQLSVSGKDLIDAGMKPGPEIGRVLGRMLQDVLDEPKHNNKDYLLSVYIPKKYS